MPAQTDFHLSIDRAAGLTHEATSAGLTDSGTTSTGGSPISGDGVRPTSRPRGRARGSAIADTAQSVTFVVVGFSHGFSGFVRPVR